MTMTSHEARKSMIVAGPVWTCGKCREPWPCETENLGRQVERLELMLGRIAEAPVYDFHLDDFTGEWFVGLGLTSEVYRELQALAEGERKRVPVTESSDE